MKANTIDVVEVMAREIARQKEDREPDSTSIIDMPVWQLYTDDANDMLEAIRSAGYVVVPVEPTEAMCEAGGPETAWASADNMRVGAQSVYSAMIAAAEGGE